MLSTRNLIHHETLSATHQKLTYDYLQRKQDLEQLRASHEDLQKENDSLLAQQISSAQEDFVPPCLKCLERDNATSLAECSTASNAAISSTADVVTNPHLRMPPLLLMRMLG